MEIIKNLSKNLSQKYEKEYDRSNLYHCLRFCKVFPQIVDNLISNLHNRYVNIKERSNMADIKYEIVEQIGVLSESAKGWTNFTIKCNSDAV